MKTSNGVKNGLPKWVMLIAIGYIMLVVTSSLAIFYLSFHVTQDQLTPAAEYVNDFELPYSPSYCPNETLEVDIAWRARKEGVVNFYETWYSLGNNQTYVLENRLRFILIAGDFEGISRVAVIVPRLPPGNYEYRRAIFTNQTQASVVRVPFIVSENCQ